MRVGESIEEGPRGRGIEEGVAPRTRGFGGGRGLQRLVGGANGGPALTKTL